MHNFFLNGLIVKGHLTDEPYDEHHSNYSEVFDEHHEHVTVIRAEAEFRLGQMRVHCWLGKLFGLIFYLVI